MTIFKQIPTARLADSVTEQLKEAIFQGRYQPGERFPPENRLVEMFGVSRIVVREAIRNLENSGLIQIKRGPTGGAFLLPMNHKSTTLVLRDALTLGRANVSHLMEVRLDVEPLVARMAALKKTEEDIESFSQWLKRSPEFPGHEYLTWNVEFHRLVAKACHNPIYEILVNILMDFTEELLSKIKPPRLAIHDRVSHQAVLERIKESDAQGAGRLYREHLLKIMPLLQKLEGSSHGKLFS
ncbi:MAG: FadR family transcriptional regulator [Deltaproteobacteria bacterium]|nr:FadR family transcriptional regulator [Deltaproteobacteria bacterium]